MTTAELIKNLCENQNISVAELARRIGQSRQNLYKKLQRDTLTLEERRQIAAALGMEFEQAFTVRNEKESVSSHIIKALTSVYTAVFHYNITEDKITINKNEEKAVNAGRLVKKGYQYAIDTYIEHNVFHSDIQYMRSVSRLSNMIDTFHRMDSFIAHYRTDRNGELHYTFMKCVRIGDADNFDSFVLAFGNEDDSTLAYRKRSVVKENRSEAAKKLLIIDDDEVSRELLAETLSDEHEIITATDGAEGLNVLIENYKQIALILLELYIPKMDGFEFMDKLKKNPLFSDIPVIIITARNDNDTEEKCLSLGAADYFVKPFNVNLLRLRMEAVIRLRESTVMIDEIEYDPVTGTLTKVAFMHHAKSLLREYPDATFDLCVFELEDMDILNEQYGMTRVDELVRYISDTLKASNTAQSVLGRLSARRFVGLDLHQEISDTRVSMYVKDMADNAPIPDIMIKAALYENIEHDISLSVAINQTLRAMETIRHQYGKYAAIFDRTVRLQMEREQMIEACMAEALEEKQFEVYYQPKHSAETGELVGAEALIRWNHPLYGFMSPGEFIPLFEKNGFISKVDAFVSQEVIANMTSWIKRGIKIPSVSINVSRVDLPQISDVGSYAVNLGKYGLTPDNIHIEITESMYVANQSRQIQIISDLRDQGFVIEMDDFGAGYSSLGLLKTLPLDIIKLDMTFVRNLDKQMEVVRAMIELAHSLGKTVIAEGVETEEQFSILRMFGCDAVQGYYFSKPLPKAGFEAYMIAQEERLQKERAAALVSDKAADLMEALKSQAYQVDMLNSAADTLDIKFSEADFNIRTAYEALKRLKDLFDVVRLVDATQKVEYRMDDDGHIRKGEHHCFEIWRRNGECQNCISAKALQTKGKYSKRENIGRDNYMVISKYVEINHVPFALELVTKLE